MDKTLPHILSLLGNPWVRWLLFFLCWIALYLIFSRLRALAEKAVAAINGRHVTKVAPFLTRLVSGTNLFLAAIFFLWLSGLATLDLTPTSMMRLHAVALAAVFAQLGIWGSLGVDFYAQRSWDTQDPSRRTALGAITFLLKVSLWLLVLLLVLDNFSINVSALLTGLGIGGVAVALAVQRVLGELIGSLSILLDRPFEVGDFIIHGDTMGTVEHIGVRSTRIRSLQGQLLVVSNNDLIQGKIQNFKRMETRRVLFPLRLSYKNSLELVERAPKILGEIITSTPETRFERAHVNDIGLEWLNLEVVYHVLSSDYNLYMDIHQSINLKILNAFKEAGIEIAERRLLLAP